MKFTLLRYKEISAKMRKIPVIYLFSELGKIRKYNIRPSSNETSIQKPNWNLWMDWDKLCLDLSFTVEKKMENIHKA